MDIDNEALKKYFIQLRRVPAGREKDAEKNIRQIYKKLLNDLHSFLGIKYAQLAEDDKIDYSILQSKGEYARFLEEVVLHIDDLSPELTKEITGVVQEVYKLCYDGMVDGVSKAVDRDDLIETFKSVKAVTPDVIKKAVENPISGLTLKDTLEKHRKDIIYDIKQSINIGLTNGDRMSTMARRISYSLNENYKKAVRIVRTEVHRVKEAGLHDAAENIDNKLNNGSSGLKMVKTWRTMKDERVRHKKANHRKMDGKTVGIDEYFDLGGGIKTKAPGQSGDAKNDINCRCFLEYSLIETIEKSSENDIIESNKANNINNKTIKNGKMNIVNDKVYWKNATFSNEKKLNRHLQSHLKEYNGYEADDYINRARELLSADLNDEIDGFVDKDGFVFKYDKINNDFAIGRPDGCISTLFKPNNKIEYWEEQKKYYKEGEDYE